MRWPLVLALAMLPGAARARQAAAPLQDAYVLPDPGYAAQPGPGEPVRGRVRQLVYPTLGFPALAPYGGEIDLVVRTLRPAGGATDWRATLRAGEGAPGYPLLVGAASYDPLVGALRLRAAVPARAPRDV